MFRPLPKIIFALTLGILPLLVLIVAQPALSPSVASAAETPKKILIFSGVDPNLPNVALMNQLLRSTLEKGWSGRIQFYSEALDNHRIPDYKYEQEMVRLLQRKYEGEKIDLIFTLSSPSLKFLLKHKAELFSDTPTIFVNTNQHESDGLDLGQNVTGVQGRIELKPALDLALSLHPDTRRVVVVTGNSVTEKLWEGLAQREFGSYGKSLEFTYLTDTTIEELRKDLASQPPHTIVFLIGFMLDREGNSYSLPEAVSLVAPSSSAPVYVPIQSGFRQGVVGGRMISYEALGQAAGGLGLRVLAGEKPQDIPPQTVESVAIFDWRELRRWGISEQNLPPGSVVRFKEPTLWEQYKWHIVGIISLLILEALLIAYLLFIRARRRRAEKESERLARLAEDERQHLDEVISNTPGVVWESRLDPVTERRTTNFVSDYVEKMLGYSVEEWLSTPGFALSLVHEEDRERVAREAEAILANGKEGVIQSRWMAKDGRALWTETQLAVVCDEMGKPIGLRGVTMDITDRKGAEEALRKVLEEVNHLKNQLEEENIYLQEEIKLEHNFTEIVGQSDAIKYVFFKIEQVAHTDTTVLITGETGTGKERVARAIHSESRRKDRPLVKVNCAALSASLIESELFGHEKGSFTGAAARKIGRFELAHGATIFLDEIGELPLELQVKLLRVIQEGEFERLGSSKTIKADVRIIAATNRKLEDEIKKGLFREDLFYRLNVFPITVPPLRQRREDVPLLVEHYVRIFSKKLGKEITSIPPATLNALRDYSWPGNVRELANMVERAVINTQGEVLRITDHFEAVQAKESELSKKTLEVMEREYIIGVLDDTGWRIEGPSGAAKILGLNPSTLRTRMAKLRIQKPRQSLV